MSRPIRPTIKPDEGSDPEVILRTVNHLVEDVNGLAAGGISPTRDLNAFTVTLESPAFPARVKNALRAGSPPVAVLVASARDMTSQGGPPAALGGVAWSAQGDQILIHDVAGRTNQTAYRITLLVLGA